MSCVSVKIAFKKCYCVGLQDSKIHLSCLPDLSFQKKKVIKAIFGQCQSNCMFDSVRQ